MGRINTLNKLIQCIYPAHLAFPAYPVFFILLHF